MKYSLYLRSLVVTVLVLAVNWNLVAQDPERPIDISDIPEIHLESIDWGEFEVEYQTDEVITEPWFNRLDGRARVQHRRLSGGLSVREQDDVHRKHGIKSKYIDLVIRTSDASARSRLETLGFQVVVERENLLAGRMPVESIIEAAKLDEVSYIQAPQEAQLMHNRTRPAVRAGIAHSGGGNLSSAYRGEDILVGIIDSGIDFLHPDFNTDDGTRLERLIDYQIRGEDPLEWTRDEINEDPDQITQEDNISGHGTHVAGSAVGNGRADAGSDNMTGIAPESEIIAVNAQSLNPETGSRLYMTVDILGGVDRVFQIADELDKPAVVNISLGSISGSRDGTSPTEEFYDELAGPGKVIVSSAGNSGFLPKHSGMDMRPRTRYIAPILAEDGDVSSLPVEAWYDRNTISEFKIVAVQHSREAGRAGIAGTTPWIRPGEEMEEPEVIISEGDTLGLIDATATVTNAARNGDSQIYAEVYRENDTTDLSEITWVFVANSTIRGGRFDMWVNRDGMVYPREMNLTRSKQLVGDNLMTVGTPASASEVISVGAFVTRTASLRRDGRNLTRFTRLDPLDPEDRRMPEAGELADFSSKGPLRTGEVVPDIAAPGYLVFSAASGFIEWNKPSLHPDGPYRSASGTSMASPHVAGAIAMMLQINPDLTAGDIRRVFANGSRRDYHTGDVPNYYFGYGKLDVASALEYLETEAPLLAEADQTSDKIEFSNYPNPFNPVTTFAFSLPERTEVNLKIYDTIGREVKRIFDDQMKEQGGHEVTFDGSRLSSGVYIVRLEAGREVITRQITLIK